MLTFQLTLPIQLALLVYEDLTVTTDTAAFAQLLNCAADYRKRYGQVELSRIPGVAVARRLFRLLDIEPTKHRPASEALLRRALKNLPLYAVNNLVDVCNWFALETLLPNGVYDYATLKPPLVLRRGAAGEEYLGHNDRVVHLENRFALADQLGVFGSPLTDSLRTAVTPATKQALVVIYTPADYDRESLSRHCIELANRIRYYCGGKLVQQQIIKKE